MSERKLDLELNSYQARARGTSREQPKSVLESSLKLELRSNFNLKTGSELELEIELATVLLQSELVTFLSNESSSSQPFMLTLPGKHNPFHDFSNQGRIDGDIDDPTTIWEPIRAGDEKLGLDLL